MAGSGSGTAQRRPISLILPAANTTMMNLLLEQVAHEFVDHFIIMQVDRAGWHRAKDLIIPEKIRLLPQPAVRNSIPWSTFGMTYEKSTSITTFFPRLIPWRRPWWMDFAN